MPSTLSLTYRDYSGESAIVALNIPIITAGNFAATQSLINDLVLAADDILLGVLRRRKINMITPGSGAVPSDEEAQRETKWVVHYTDVTANLAAGVTNPYFGKSFTMSIGTAELTDHLGANSELAAIGDAGEVDAFVTAFEAFMRSPSGGAVEVNQIKHKGRNI